jgi:uncharacterized protein (DUF2141 family)
MPRTTPTLVTLSLLFACTAAAARPDAPVEPAPAATEPAAEPAAAAPGSLSLRLSGFHSADGQVLIAVFRGEDGFPGKPEQAAKTVVAKISNGRVRLDLADLEPGEYAVSVVHDENGNNTLDTNWVGMPKEGIGTSNNAKGRMGPPKYRDAKFTVTAAGAVQAIDIVYL